MNDNILAEKMTDYEFARKCDAEDTIYAITEYGLGVKDLHEDSKLRPLVEKVESVRGAIIELECAIQDILEAGDE